MAQPENCCVLIPGVRNTYNRFITTGSWRNHTRELAALNKYQNENPLAALHSRLTAVRDPIVVRVPKSLAVDGIVRLFRVSLLYCSHTYSPEGHQLALELSHHRDSCRSVLFSEDGTGESIIFSSKSDRAPEHVLLMLVLVRQTAVVVPLPFEVCKALSLLVLPCELLSALAAVFERSDLS